METSSKKEEKFGICIHIHTCCHGNNVSPEQEAQSPCWLVADLYVHVDLRIYSALFSRRLTLQEQITASHLNRFIKGRPHRDTD